MTGAVTVTVLGLGNMGSTLARAFIRAGNAVTVFNRSPERRNPFVGQCTVAATAADACAASSLVVVCLADYAATRAVIERPAVVVALSGSTLVQLSSGGPADARELGKWADSHGISYLDGAILTFPARIGDEPTMIAYSGARSAFDSHRETLCALGGRPVFVSDAVGGAAALDLAWLSFLYGNTVGLLQGAAFCESENVDPAYVFQAVPSFLVEIAAEAAYYGTLLRRGDYRGDQATIDVHVAAMEHIARTATQNGINAEFPELILDLFSRAAATGHGLEEIAGAIDVFRRPPCSKRD
jgi:3-hydroxyisobutyrate dehydrogenase-like beta-hydroxyacid dehydrogenase